VHNTGFTFGYQFQWATRQLRPADQRLP